MYGFDMIFPMNGDINAIIRAAMVLTSAYPLLVNPRSSVTGFVNRLAHQRRIPQPHNQDTGQQYEPTVKKAFLFRHIVLSFPVHVLLVSMEFQPSHGCPGINSSAFDKDRLMKTHLGIMLHIPF